MPGDTFDRASSGTSRARTAVTADDHGLVLYALDAIVAQVDRLEIVGRAEDGLTALALVKRHEPDIAIVDLAMPLLSGTRLVAEITRWSPRTVVFVLTGLTARRLLRQAEIAGARAVALKNDPPDSLAAAIALVLEGERYRSAGAAAIMEEPHEGDRLWDRLTVRESEVLSVLLNGANNAEIGAALGISPKTADNHRSAIMRKLNVRSRAQLLALALREDLIGEFEVPGLR